MERLFEVLSVVSVDDREVQRLVVQVLACVCFGLLLAVQEAELGGRLGLLLLRDRRVAV